MSLLIGTFTIGFILSLLALGVFISFRIFAFPDITADGSVTLGAAVAATLMAHGTNPLLASLAAFVAGMLAGGCTGTLYTRFKINSLLSGILVMTALYSINLHIMGKSNVPLLSVTTLATQSEQIGIKLMRGATSFDFAGWDVSVRDASVLGAVGLVVVLTAALLYLFLRTNLGMAMRATGDNVQMIRALGVNDANMIVFGVAISNGFVALSGALLAQYQGFANRHGGVGTGQRHHRRSFGGNEPVRHHHHRRGHGFRALPVARSHGIALGTKPQRPEAHHRSIRLRRPHRAAVPAEEAVAERTCLKFKAPARHSMRTLRMKCVRCAG
jgi:putative ABC transport system permease protein